MLQAEVQVGLDIIKPSDAGFGVQGFRGSGFRVQGLGLGGFGVLRV